MFILSRIDRGERMRVRVRNKMKRKCEKIIKANFDRHCESAGFVICGEALGLTSANISAHIFILLKYSSHVAYNLMKEVLTHSSVIILLKELFERIPAWCLYYKMCN